MKNLLLVFAVLAIASTATANDYYWVGGAGDWSDYENHWATSSGGSSFHSSVPTSSDNVYFDEQSFTTESNILTIDVDATCFHLDWSDVNTLALVRGNMDIDVYADLTLNKSTDYSGFYGNFRLRSNVTTNIDTDANATLRSTSSSYGGLSFFGSGVFILSDSVNSGNINVYNNAELDINGQYLDIHRFYSSSSFVGHVDFTDSKVNVNFLDLYSEGETAFNFDNSTLNIATRLILGNGTYEFAGVTLSGAQMTMNAGTSALIDFAHLTLNQNLQLSITPGSILKITEVTANGTPIEPIILRTTSPGQVASLSSETGVHEFDYVILEDIQAVGGATFNATNSVANDLSTGWNVTAPESLDYYWVGGTGNWDEYETHWATSSGGSTFYSRPPSRYDNVHFDANSTSSIGTAYVYLTYENKTCQNFDASEITENLSLSYSRFMEPLSVYGDVSLSSQMNTSNLMGFFNMMSNENTTITTDNLHWNGVNGGFKFYGDGPFDIVDSLIVPNVLFYNQSEVDLSDKYISGNSFALYSGFNGTLDLSNSTIDVAIFEDRISSSIGVFYDLKLEGTTISVSQMLRSYNAFQSYGKVIINADHDEMVFSKSSNDEILFDTLIIQPGATVRVPVGLNLKTNSLKAKGNRKDFITISSNKEGSQFSFEIPEGTIEGEYLDLRDCEGKGGATFNANYSIDNGNNTNWTFSDIPPLDYYWVGNSGNWSDVNHWATTSGGDVIHATPPSRIDRVYFDQNSFTEAEQLVTLDSDVEFGGLSLDEVANSPGFQAEAGIEVNVHGHFVLNSSVDFSNFKAVINTKSDLDSTSIDFDGNSSFYDTYLNFDGTGNYYLNGDVKFYSVTVYGDVNIDFNGYQVDFGTFAIDGSAKGSVDFSTSEIYTNYFYNGISYYDQSEFELDADSSSIYVRFSFSWYSDQYNYGNLTLTNDNPQVFLTNYYYTDLNLATLNIEPGASVSLPDGHKIICEELIAVGNKNQIINIHSEDDRFQAIIVTDSALLKAEYLNLKDIKSESEKILLARYSEDLGNNTGWQFTKPLDATYYWVGGSGDWSDVNHWATSSGGSSLHRYLPSKYDQVIFDENSFSEVDPQINLDTTGYMKSLDMSGISMPTELIMESQMNLNVYGDLRLSADLTINSFYNEVNLTSSDSAFIEMNGFENGDYLSFNIDGEGAYSLQSDFVGYFLNFRRGRFYVNGHDMNLIYLNVYRDFEGVIDFSGSNLTISYLNLEEINSPEINIIEDELTVFNIIRSFSFRSGYSFNHLVLGGESSFRFGGSYASSITVNKLGLKAGTSYTFRRSTTNIDEIWLQGTSESITNITSYYDNQPFTFIKADGEVSLGRVYLKDCHASGGATFSAVNSTDGGNNTGWNFISDDTGPSFISGYPQITDVTGNSLIASVALNEIGKVGYVVQETGMSAPTVEQILAGRNGSNNLANISGEIAVPSSNTSTQSVIGSLMPVTSYTIYFAAEDVGGTAQASASSIAFTTSKANQVLSLNHFGTKRYGSSEFEITAASNSGLTVSVSSNNPEILSISGNTASVHGAGEVVLTLSQAGNAAYEAATKQVTINIQKATLSISVADANKVYGQANPSFTFEYQGFIGDDDESILDETPEATTSANELSVAGTYIINIQELSDENYEIVPLPGILTIAKKSLTVSTGDYERSYGGENPSFILEYSGFVNGDNAEELESVPVVIPNATRSSSVGVYDIILSGGEDSRYDFEASPGQLTVTKAELTPTLSSLTKVYGEDNPVLEFGFSGFVNGESRDVLDALPTATISTTSASNAGSYPVTVTSGVDNNYQWTLDDYSFEITKASLSLVMDDYTKVYGAANPGFSFSYDGFVNGDDESDLDELPSVTSEATSSSDVGTYALLVSGGSDNNYNYSISADADLTITKAPLSVSVGDYSKVYGESNPVFEIEFDGFVNEDDENDLSDEFGVSTTAGQFSSVGTYDLTFTGLTQTNYEVESTDGSLEIVKATLNLEVIDSQSSYGEDIDIDFTYSGFVGSDNAGNLDEEPVLGVENAADPGTYEVVFTEEGEDNNYTFSLPDDASHEITKATLVATVSNSSKTYGESNPEFEISFSGFVLDESVEDLLEIPAIETLADETSPVGVYPLTLSEVSDPHYIIELLDGEFTITKALLNVIVNDTWKYAGEVSPELTYEISGFVNNENVDVITQLPLITTEVTLESTPGEYVISASNALATNYDFQYISGVFYVLSEAQQVILFPLVADKVYGDEAFALNATASSGLAVVMESSDESILSVSDGIATIHSVGEVTITVSQSGDDEFDPAASVSRSFVINKAELNVIADDQQITYGDELPELTLTYQGFVYSENVESLIVAPVGMLSSDTISEAGEYEILISEASSDNYDISYESGTLSILKAAQIISVDSIENKLITDEPFEITASVSSDLLLSYQISGPATIQDELITLNGEEGLVEITISQSGNKNFEAAENVTVQFFVDDPTSNFAPELEIINPLLVTVGEIVSFNVIGSDEDIHDQLHYTLDQISVDKGMEIGELSGAFLWRPELQDVGSHTLVVSVSDTKETVSITLEIEVVSNTLSADADGMSVVLYPTEIENDLTLSISDSQTGQVSVQILNLFGQVIQQKIYQKDLLSKEILIEVNPDLTSGVYIALVRFGNRTHTQRIIKK